MSEINPWTYPNDECPNCGVIFEDDEDTQYCSRCGRHLAAVEFEG